MKLSSIVSNTTLVASMLLTGNAYSAYIDQGVYIEDTGGGLDWLKMSETVGISYDNNASISYLSTGWRYATKAEVGALIADFIPDTGEWDINYNANIANEAGNFLSVFTPTYFNGGGWYNYIWGFTAETNPNTGEHWAPFVGWDNINNNFGIVGFNTLDPDYPSYYADATLGHWIVRSNVTESAVPAPAVALLMAIGLFGLKRRHHLEI